MEELTHSIEKIDMPMSVNEVIVRSSIPILSSNSEHEMPTGFGSGFIVIYKQRLFLITVFHVIRDGERFFLETTKVEDRKPYLKEVGGFYHFDKLKFKGTESAQKLNSMLESGGEKLDIAFAEIHLPLDLNQNEIDYGFFKIEKGTKIFIGMESAKNPKPEKLYGLSGNIQQRTSGVLLYSRPTFKYNLQFHRTEGAYHIFIVPEPSINPEEYKGCSGAPIFDEEGNVVAIAANVYEGKKILRGFSMLYCKELLDIALSTETL